MLKLLGKSNLFILVKFFGNFLTFLKNYPTKSKIKGSTETIGYKNIFLTEAANNYFYVIRKVLCVSEKSNFRTVTLIVNFFTSRKIPRRI